MTSQLIANGLISGSHYALLGLGFAVIYASCRILHFAHGSVVTAAAYIAYLFFIVLHVPLPLAIVVSILVAAGMGSAVELGIYRPLRRRGAGGLVMLIASMGVFIVIQNAISLAFGDGTKSLRGGQVAEGVLFLGARITPVQIVAMATGAVLFIAVSLILSKTKFGKAIRAVAADPELAVARGIDTDRVILVAFALGSALAAVAAVLMAADLDMTPAMGMSALLMAVVSAIIGGAGSIPGAALGGLLLGMAQSAGAWYIHTEWQNAMAFGILLVFLLVRPQGLFGKPVRAVEL